MIIILRYLITVLIIYLLIRFIQKRLQTLSNPQQSDSNTFNRTKNQHADPFEILGVAKNANAAEIKKAYHEALSKYHPDKVEHLGDEIKQVAREKTVQIQRAYEQIK